jgi:hypothetical protein
MQTNRLLPHENTLRPAAQSSFRSAFSQARQESRGAELEIRAAIPAATYEVWIEKRVGKRRIDSERWNALGREGWMLVAVVGKQAFFRREHST